MPPFPPSLSQWKYRKAFQITEQAGQNLTDYQKLIKIGESSGATGCDFHLEGLSAIFPSGKNQGGDIRITDSDKTTLLSFWVERITGTSPNRIAYVWVKIPSLSANQTKTLYCYFGNPNASNVSNGNNTFVFFDDFDSDTIPTRWTYTGSGSYSVSGSIISLYNSDAAGRKYCTQSQVLNPSGSYAVRAYCQHAGAYDVYVGMRNADYSNRFFHDIAVNWGNYKAHDLVVGGSQARYIQYESSDTNWHIVEEANFGTTFYAFLDGVQKDSYTVSNQSHGYVGFTHSGSGYQYIDWILARKFVYPEPVFSSAGNLERGSSIIPFII